jgi:SAM-dependent methyltransferase
MMGRRFECPCCGGRFRTLLPAGIDRRPNARCPRCGSLERHRLIALFLRERTDFFRRSLRVLDVAPEEWMQTQLRRAPGIEYLSIDLESTLAMRQMDVTRLELPDASFDVIFCNHVLEHVPDDLAAMRELLRVLKPGGWAILQTPFDPARERTDEDPAVTDPDERLRRFGQRDHVRTYGRDLFERLASCGWRITRDRFAGSLDSAVCARYALDPAEELIVGRH